jgi:hypothetical protein
MNTKKAGATILVMAFFSMLVLGAEKTVFLKNGKSFAVQVSPTGDPLPIKTAHIAIQNGGPVVAPSSKVKLPKPPATKEACFFMIMGKLKGSGKYKVTVSSPLDDSIVSHFEANGGEDFYFQGLEASEFPAAWAWLDDPGETWFPMAMKFESDKPERTFEILQWISISETSKAALKAMITNIKTGK